MVWPFRRKPAPMPDKRGWNEDWRVGDLALCVTDAWTDFIVNAPLPGQVLTVTELREGPAVNGEGLVSGLAFEGRPFFWHCAGFRKLRPNERAARETWQALLRNPTETPEPVTARTLSTNRTARGGCPGITTAVPTA